MEMHSRLDQPRSITMIPFSWRKTQWRTKRLVCEPTSSPHLNSSNFQTPKRFYAIPVAAMNCNMVWIDGPLILRLLRMQSVHAVVRSTMIGDSHAMLKMNICQIRSSLCTPRNGIRSLVSRQSRCQLLLSGCCTQCLLRVVQS
jgi:hypothetical protein